MSFNQRQLLGVFEFDTVTNAWLVPVVLHPVVAGAPYPLTIAAVPTGPRPVFITELEVSFQDIAITDPSGDRYLGWRLQSAVDGTATPTFTTLKSVTANADLPLMHDNSVSNTAIQAVANIPVGLFNYVGQTRSSPDVMYPTLAAQPSSAKQGPIRIAADSVFRVQVAAYLAGSAVAISDLADVVVAAWGYSV